MRGTARGVAHGQAVESTARWSMRCTALSNDRRTQVKARRQMRHREARVAAGKRPMRCAAREAGRWRRGVTTPQWACCTVGQQAGRVGGGGMTVKALRSSRSRQAGDKGDEAAAGSQRSSRDR